MTVKTKIAYAHSTWNPVTGCSAVSEGCRHCYAERMAKRLHGMGVAKYRNSFEVTLHPDQIKEPLRWRKPHLVFTASMSDLFHEKVPLKFIRSIFETMQQADQHIFQLLTKRSKRLAKFAPKLPWPSNVWAGVTVENARFRDRIDDLRQVDAAVRWLSMEPLLGPVETLDLDGIDWVVVGGESGPGARPMEEKWVLDIQKQCRAQGSAFFFKQWGGFNRRKTGRLLRGRLYSEMPELPDPDRQLSLASLL
ncbi:MAG: phage Gp37/Gp68 family protein [candidate division Zixibacteria bacterium]|nr:phage Gp37/Gp68 family protein [candidate division Zixibacteria bacterium]